MLGQVIEGILCAYNMGKGMIMIDPEGRRKWGVSDAEAVEVELDVLVGGQGALVGGESG